MLPFSTRAGAGCQYGSLEPRVEYKVGCHEILAVSRAEPMNTDDDRRDREMTFLITEFNVLRSEFIDNLGTARTMIGLFLVSLGAVGSLAVSGHITPQVIVILPLLSSVFWWVHLDTRMVVAEIALYIATQLAPQARELGSERSLAWEDWIRTASTETHTHPSSAFWVFKLSTGLDGSAWPVYLLPSILALVLTVEGATAPILLFKTQAHSSFYYPVWLWWLGGGLQILLVGRAFTIERTWWNATKVSKRKGLPSDNIV